MNLKKIILFFLFIILLNNCFAGVSVIGGLTQKKTLNPGEQFDGVVLLKNTDNFPSRVKIYLTDYLFFADGRSLYDKAGSTPHSNAKWISLSPDTLNIPANSLASAYYTIHVPADTSLKGTYWSIIMVEMIPKEQSENKDEDANNAKFGIQTIMRYGIQIITNLGDTGEQKIKFLEKKLLNNDNKKILQIDIENIGELMLSPMVWADFYDKKGNNIGRFDSEEKRIYPGCSVRHEFNLTRLQKGEYKASIIVDNGNDYVFGAHYDLSIE